MFDVQEVLIEEGRLSPGKERTWDKNMRIAGSPEYMAEYRLEGILDDLGNVRVSWEEGELADEELVMEAEKARAVVDAYNFVGLINQRAADEWHAKIDNYLLSW